MLLVLPAATRAMVTISPPSEAPATPPPPDVDTLHAVHAWKEGKACVRARVCVHVCGCIESGFHTDNPYPPVDPWLWPWHPTPEIHLTACGAALTPWLLPASQPSHAAHGQQLGGGWQL
jgi:hypothetical protein